MPDHDFDEQLAALAAMSSAQLHARWSAVTSTQVPRISPELLRLALAWELQATRQGGLSRGTLQRLDQLARGNSSSRDVQPGMRLMREWNGMLHIVTVDEDGTIRWNGQNWASLSAVARAITGTRWPGPAFFGLRQKSNAA